jgi:PAS domain-containing protein
MADQSGDPRGEQLSEFDKTNPPPRREVRQQLSSETQPAQRAVNALKQWDTRFHAVFENAAVGIALISLERKPIAFNAITEKIIGYSFEEMEHIDPRILHMLNLNYIANCARNNLGPIHLHGTQHNVNREFITILAPAS